MKHFVLFLSKKRTICTSVRKAIDLPYSLDLPHSEPPSSVIHVPLQWLPARLAK